ncbi:hypothetical protein [Limosilactobacillus fermentum]|uniref:hypothetical protein n=1 Tax=Limosilactobacillus fermentum TaxID=1613 RepID=UPI003DA1D81F
MVSIERESSTLQGSGYREHLNNNWETIEDELNRLEGLISQNSTVTTEELQDQITGLSQRINRIILGTDEDAIRLVVTAILQEQGVIK